MKKMIKIISEFGSVIINCEAIDLIKTCMTGHHDLEGKQLCKIMIFLTRSNEQFVGYIHWDQHSDFQHFIFHSEDKFFSTYDDDKIVDHVSLYEIFTETEIEEKNESVR